MDSGNCPPRQLREMLLVPHFEVCDGCYYQEEAVREIEGAVRKAVFRSLVREKKGRLEGEQT